ncbi:PAS domain-containing sensor histidine kinase [Olleya aquimaris]|uniref:histidine kinase n=1 Tax=Olleya aquimaris TaxID=639310 RepID=A0A327RC64_9FLAO|nr:HAMP domain-containing sensor histidine kinase [Olleya aquimaris]RAJ13194.1 PAS domain S-box-containing protein [Olleya aquimaris]
MLLNKNEVNDFLETLEKSLIIGSWSFDIEANTLSWSNVTKRIHEVSPSFVPDVTKGLNFYKEGLHRNRITELFNNAINKGESFDDEFIIVTAKGNEKWVRSVGFPKHKDGKCISVQGVFQDTTEKTLIAIQTALKEKQFRSIFQNSLTGMALVSLEGDWLEVNHALCNMLGYTDEEFFNISFKDLTHPKDKYIGDEEIPLMLAGKLDHFQAEKRFIHKKGKTVYCILSCTIVKNYNNKPLHFIFNISDITKIKLGKKKIKSLLDISSKQNERLLNFAHIVSHNLRSHVSNLEMLVQLKKEEVPKVVNDEYYPLFETAIGNLNETIINLNQVVINKINKSDLKSLNLFNSVEKAIGNLNALILADNVKVNISINKNIKVKALPAYLDSILNNLLTNAIKYKKQNIIPEINIKAIKDKKFIIVSVNDNGLGIDLKKNKHNLFGMYKVFHKHKNSRGLGLFITKIQLEAIGGKVEVESKIGKGSTFKIYLKNG